ncbi:o-succinylbenzoate synthase [Shewanella psychrotolerans]|uniref:o-succinylbenzoate synthase n=1 Tax=Shewanella psychrotolerans TaxID=2864206 RepID=UPI001C6567C5|nr:o-succinylbenzoate synthase [Shewanella psychrotolerans]QYK01222.1 o-succinylbenzoate synthase [Shewanella psychrotolerans]
MTLLTLSLYRYQIPLDKLLPVGNQRIETREGLVLQVSTETQQQAVEISPLSGIDIDEQPIKGFSQESIAEIIHALTESMPSLQGEPIDKLLDIADTTPLASLAYGLSLLHTKLDGKLSLYRDNASTIPLIYRHQDEATAHLQQRVSALSNKVHAVKVKVGQTSMEDELLLIHQILAIRPDLKLRLDANRAFTLEQAIDFCACLPLASIEYIEEPCRSAKDNVQLFQAVGIPFALDESLNDINYQFNMLPGLTALVLKPMLIGHLNRLQQLIEEAHANGVRAIISSSLETSLGIEALKAISQECTPDEIPGLDTLSAFSSDLIVSSGKPRCLAIDDLTLIEQCK